MGRVDDELLAIELQEFNEGDFDLSPTGFDPKEIDDLLLAPETTIKQTQHRLFQRTPFPARATCGCAGKHCVLCGDSTSADAVTRNSWASANRF
jgi:hypothetical protein